MSTTVNKIHAHTGLSLRANFSWTFVGNTVYSACQWGALMVLAKLGTPEMVGQFAIGLAIATPVMMFSQLGIRYIQATDAKDEYQFGDYLGLRLLTTVVAMLVIVGLTFGLGYRFETALVILAVGLARVFEAISDVFYGMLQLHERMDYIARSLMLKGGLSLIGMAAGIFLTGSIVWGAVGMAIAWGVLLFVYDIPAGLSVQRSVAPDSGSGQQSWLVVLRPHFDWSILGKLTWLALPVGISTLLITLNANIPRYFVEQHLGERELGIFAAIAYLPVVGFTIANALARAAQPRLAKHYAACDRRSFRHLLVKLLGIGALLGLIGVVVALVIGREALTLLYSAEYAVHTDVLVLIMIAVGINYAMWFLGSGATAARYLKIQVPILATVTIIEILGCYWLIPILGLHGAGWALVIASVVQVILYLIIVADVLHKFPQPVPAVDLIDPVSISQQKGTRPA